MTRPETQLLIKASEIYRQSKPDDLVNYNMRLALHMAQGYRRTALKHGIAWQDLQGEALLTLVKAADNYPDSKAAKNNVPFRAYLDRAIKYRFFDLCRDAPIAYSPSHRTRKEILTLNATIGELAKKESGWVRDESLAKELKWPLEKVQRFRRYSQAVSDHHSLDRPVYEDSNKLDTLKDVIPDENNMEEEILNKVEIKQEKRWLSEAIAELNPLPRIAVILTFGLEPPESIPAPTAEDVIRTALGQSSNTGNGIRRLRDKREDEEGDMPEKIQRHKGVPRGGRRAGSNPASKEAGDRAADFWKRASREKWFPGLCGDKPARKMGVG